jgi:hypothetical protein
MKFIIVEHEYGSTPGYRVATSSNGFQSWGVINECSIEQALEIAVGFKRAFPEAELRINVNTTTTKESA